MAGSAPFLRRPAARLLVLLSILPAAVCLRPHSAWAVVGSDSGSSVFNGVYVNQLIGATTFYGMGFGGSRAIVANIEAGSIWDGHESLSGRVSRFIAHPGTVAGGSSQLGQYDWHATMVGHVLGGVGIYTHQEGIAPTAQLWSASIATAWVAEPGYDYTGSFDVTEESFLYAYLTPMRTGIASGAATLRANVINSSWGFDDPAGKDIGTIAIDALLRENNIVGVLSAGNSGTAVAAVGGPASGFNGISVAAMTGDTLSPPFSAVADFSSRGPGDFYNPVTGVTVTAARPTVDIAAPGDNMTLAFYGGVTGGHVSGSDPTAGDGGAYQGQYYIPDVGGTSFAAPIVAGGAALMVDAGAAFVAAGLAPETMLDARVIKATMMAGATATNGWNNGQHSVGGVITTEQALDNATGAGMINLDNAYRIYVGDPVTFTVNDQTFIVGGVNTTQDVAGSYGGTGLSLRGWDLGSVESDSLAPAHNLNTYLFDEPLAAGSTFTAALTWFADRTLGSTLDSATDVALSNLSLELLRTDAAGGPAVIAQSISPFSTSEFLRLTVMETGSYAIRVRGLDQVYNTAATPVADTAYGLAWNVVAVPEPSTWAMLAGAAAVLTIGIRRPSRPGPPSAAARPGPPCRRSGSPCG